MGMCSLEVVFVLYTEAGTLKPVTTWTSFLSKVWPRFRRPSSLPAVFQLCCYCYSLPFPSEPHNIPGWSGIVWWMLSISLNVHAEVFLRRRSARDAFYFFLLLLSSTSVFLLKWCVLCLQLFSVFFYTIFFFAFQLFIYLFAPRTVVLCGHTHTHLLHMDLVFVVTHTTGGDVSGRWSETKKREDCAGLYLIVCSPVCFNFFEENYQWVTWTFSFVSEDSKMSISLTKRGCWK